MKDKVKALAIALGVCWTPSATAEVDESLQPASPVTGIVVDASGRPVAAARLTLKPRFRPPGSRRVTALAAKLRRENHSLSDGRFSYPDLVPNGEYLLVVEKEGFATTEMVFTAAPPPPAPPRKLKVVMRLGCTLTGLTVDERGAPVSGAKIQALRDFGGRRVNVLNPNPRDVTVSATSDSQGRFELPDLSPAKVGIELFARGYLRPSVEVLDLTGCRTHLELGRLVLVAGAAISGQVTDRQGRPLEGADVYGKAVGQESPRPWTKTSAEGRFVLRGLPPGQSVALRARHEGYFMGQPITAEPPFDARVTLVLDRVSDLPQVVGATLDPQGQPVAEARVHVQSSRIRVDVDGLALAESSTGKSDAGGRFVLRGVTVDSFTVQVSAEGFQTTEVEIEDHRPGSEVVLRLHPAASVEGVVLDAQGRPVADAGIILVVKSPETPYASATSDEDGRYHLSGLPPGPQSIELKLFSNGHRNAVRDVDLEPGKNLLDFEVEPSSVVSGRVRDEEGRPVAGATVDLHSAGTGGMSARAAITADDGAFSVRDVPRGPYAVEVRKEGFAFVRFEERVRVLTAGTEVSGIEVVLPHGGSIVGTVHGLDDAELSKLTVTAIDTAFSVYQIRAHLETDGSYRIPGLRPGSWWVQAKLDRRSMTRTAVVRSGYETRLDLDFGGGLELTGQVLRGAEPLSELRIDLESLETGVGFSASTGGDGRFRLAGLEPGDYRLSSRFGTLRRRLELDGPLDLRVDLDSLETRVSGSIVDAASAEPLPGVYLALEPLGLRHDHVDGSSDEDGRFSLSGTLEGSFLLRAGKDGYSPLARRVELRSGEPVTDLKFKLSPVTGLSLEVRWVEGYTPEYVHVMAFDAAGQRLSHEGHRLGQDGRFELRQAPAQGGWLLLRAEGAATVRLPIMAAKAEIHPLLLEPEAFLEISMPPMLGPRDRVSLKHDRGEDYFLGYTGYLSAGGLDKVSIDALPAGTWTVVVESAGGAVWSESVTTRPGRVTVLDLR